MLPMAPAQSAKAGLPKISLHFCCSRALALGGMRLSSGFSETSDSKEVSIGEAEMNAWKERTRNKATLPTDDDEY